MTIWEQHLTPSDPSRPEDGGPWDERAIVHEFPAEIHVVGPDGTGGRFTGPAHFVPQAIGTAGVVAGIAGWEMAGPECGVVSITASLLLALLSFISSNWRAKGRRGRR